MWLGRRVLDEIKMGRKEKFKASLIEGAIVNLFTPYELGFYLLVESVCGKLAVGGSINAGNYYSRKVKNYEVFVRSQEDYDWYEGVKNKLDKDLCGRLAIRTAKLFKRI